MLPVVRRRAMQHFKDQLKKEIKVLRHTTQLQDGLRLPQLL